MIVLATAPTVEELEKLVNEYFYSENYRIEKMKVYKLTIEIQGANTHTTMRTTTGRMRSITLPFLLAATSSAS